MLSEAASNSSFQTQYVGSDEQLIDRLENSHRRRYSTVLVVLAVGFLVFVAWSSVFNIDQVVRASGEVIASSRVQIIQAVDGGVLAEISVREGDRVEKGDQLARLDQTRIGAAVSEIDARLSALNAKATRLRAEVVGAEALVFAEDLQRFPELIAVENALFEQRNTGLAEDLHNLQVAVRLAVEEAAMVDKLARSGDVNGLEAIRAKRAVNEAKAKHASRKNQYLEDNRLELAKLEDEIAQNTQILTQRRQQLNDSVAIASTPGIVKNVRVTTVGGVLSAGEELMQIVPVDDELLIETKVRPSDIAEVAKGMDATIRFDPFDYTIYGGVAGTVVYVSADTLKEQGNGGEEIYYRAHIALPSNPALTSSGKELLILPGMTAQVDIKTGERTLLKYLLKPLRKTISESFGER